jgi:hypothetical protein
MGESRQFRTALIISPRDDVHALAVQTQAAQLWEDRGQCLIFDPATFPIASRMEWQLETARAGLAFAFSDPLAEIIGPSAAEVLARRDRPACAIDMTEISGIWLRRSRSSISHPAVTDGELDAYCRRVSNACVRALFALAPTYNAPSAERACVKPLQLWTARTVGLNIPRTKITTDPQEADRFVRNLWLEKKEVIYKNAADATGWAIPTRILQESDLDRLDTVRYSPTLLQERISGGPDLRVAVIDGHAFACEWHGGSKMPNQISDVRYGDRHEMVARPLGDETRDKLFRFHHAMGLTFGVYDFKINEAGEVFFLEVNPSGQWLDLEVQGGHPISETWARLLLHGTGKREKCSLPPLTEADLERIAGDESSLAMPDNWVTVFKAPS